MLVAAAAAKEARSAGEALRPLQVIGGASRGEAPGMREWPVGRLPVLGARLIATADIGCDCASSSSAEDWSDAIDEVCNTSAYRRWWTKGR